jgi:hypothetical protein
MRYGYRVVPQLNPGLLDEIVSHSTSSAPRLLACGARGFFGLRTVALEAASLNYSPGDRLSGWSYLLKPLMPAVRDALRGRTIWGEVSGPGRFEIALAGVIGEPLCKEALLDLGLAEDEMEKIREFYTLSV